MGGGHENFYLLNVCCLGGSPKNLLGVEGGLPKKFFLICKILIAPHHINYECSLSELKFEKLLGVSYSVKRLKKCKTLENLNFEIFYPLRFKRRNCSLTCVLNSGPLVY